MSKKTNITTIDIKKSVMRKVKQNEIQMKPRWYFIVGSIVSVIGFIASSVLIAIVVSIAFFALRSKGLMNQWKTQQLIELFPWWVFIVAFASIVVGVFLLKKFEFSYKKNFVWIIIAFLVSCVVSGYILDVTGVTAIWLKRGPMNRWILLQENNSTINFPSHIQQNKQGNGKQWFRWNQ